MDQYDENAAALISIIRNDDPKLRQVQIETLNIIGHILGSYNGAQQQRVLCSLIGQIRKLLEN